MEQNNRFVYIFNPELATLLKDNGLQVEEMADKKSFVIFNIKDADFPEPLKEFRAGKDYIFTNKMFF